MGRISPPDKQILRVIISGLPRNVKAKMNAGLGFS
jgi:hypothetical protein